MPDYKAPVGWKFYGSTSDQTTFTLPGHTVAAPRLAIFDRKVPQSNGGKLTNPNYKVRIIYGFADVDGNPLESRAVIEANIRWPVAADGSVIEGAIDIMGEMLTNVDFQDDVVAEQLLPREVTVA
nr:MAG: coat protein [Leviviridae sp.]